MNPIFRRSTELFMRRNQLFPLINTNSREFATEFKKSYDLCHLLPYVPPKQVQPVLKVLRARTEHLPNHEKYDLYFNYMEQKFCSEKLARYNWFFTLASSCKYTDTS